MESVLLLDLRVQTQYAASHIQGALNLCIPTTLLKRPSFNVQKLAEAFKDDEQRHRFERWRSSSYIIVYDGSSALHKDAAVCINTIKKFRSEGYNGTLYIVKGGFAEFSRRFPLYIEREGGSNQLSSATGGVDTEGPECAPVMGGCPMPATDKPANPFFGNIRQNMDLIGGVGQIPVKHPSKETKSAERDFPEWLQTASDERDQGKKVSVKFEQIERREKKRMEDALSGHVSYGTPKVQTPGNSVRIAGLEKGNKNRYNNIWPFEHTRVKLQGVANHGCDYINASHVKAAYSNKRYISTQAPIPATFNDFWNVVWQQDVRVIVMLSAEKEGAQVKAHNYWDKRQYGPLHIEFLSEKRASIEPSRIHRHRNQQHRPPISKRSSTGPQLPLAQLDTKEERAGDQPYVIVRRFTLRHEKHPFESMREITQLQYTNWPDFGAPAHPAHLLGLVEQCDTVVRSTNRTNSNEPEGPSKRPILVHCSAGCGRTGTFCTVDSVIDMLKRQRISRRQRETSPMDVDKPLHRAPSSAKKDGGSFFPPQPQSQASEQSIEGSWVYRDDQDLVEKTVEDFRRQRLSMVQSLRQYVLCYESIMEWLVEQHGSGSS
jgi:protein-tyrosine phosphatase